MDWPDHPATERQLLQLKELGFVPTRALLMTEAARLIRQYHRRPASKTDQSAASGPLGPQHAAETRQPVSHALSGEISGSAKMHVHRLHAEVDTAKRALAINPDGPNVRADLAAKTVQRRTFWMDTFLDPRQMRIGSVQVFEFYQCFGSGFCTPSNEQVQQVLDALDTVMAFWDKDHPELFYQTLELNFPNSVRQR